MRNPPNFKQCSSDFLLSFWKINDSSWFSQWDQLYVIKPGKASQAISFKYQVAKFVKENKKKKINSTVILKIVHNHQIYLIPFIKDGALFQISINVICHIQTSKKSTLNRKKIWNTPFKITNDIKIPTNFTSM